MAFIAAFVLAYYAWLIFGSGDWFHTHGGNASNRAAIFRIREELRVGDDYEKVLRIYWQYAADELRLYSGCPQTWTVSMPPELGASQWVLFLDFSDGKVSAIKVRTSEGPPPSDGPEDVGVKNPVHLG